MKSVGFRCPEDLAKKIEEKQIATGKTKSEVILEMITGLPSLPIIDRKNLPKEGVVYIVWAEDRLLYIGQTQNLLQRFSNHHRLVEFLNSEANVSWFNREKCDRLEIESALIEILSPELNKVREPKEQLDDKSIMATKDKRIQVVLSDEDWDKFRRYVFEKNISMSEELGDYIKRVIATSKN